jgi:hypothetical protein
MSPRLISVVVMAAAVDLSACSLLTSFDGFVGGSPRDGGASSGSGGGSSGADAKSESGSSGGGSGASSGSGSGSGGDEDAAGCTPGPDAGVPPGGPCGGSEQCAPLACACNNGVVIDSSSCFSQMCGGAMETCTPACSGLGGWTGHC